MLLIGEKINGSRPDVAAAIASRDEEAIRQLAVLQVEAGAGYLDVHAGTPPEQEVPDLVWLVRTVQAEVDVPLCVDTASPTALEEALAVVERVPMVNSVSAESHSLERNLPAAAAHGCPVIMVAFDERGPAPDADGRLTVIRRLIGHARESGITDDRIYVDPLITALATGEQQGRVVLDTIRRVREEFPETHIVGGASNVSFGLPVRSLINCAFMVLAIEAGLDAAILDPTDRELRGIILATEVALGGDRFCRNYTNAFRAGRIGSIPDQSVGAPS